MPPYLALRSTFRRLPSACSGAGLSSSLQASYYRSESVRGHSPRGQESSSATSPRSTDFGSLNIFGDTPVPSTSVDICLHNGFRLNGGAQVSDGSGVLLIGGEAFAWRPWDRQATFFNTKGQWDVGDDAFALLSLLWPRPDLLILGVGPHILQLSPATKRYITALGMRVEVLDTRNAASQFNLLATERGLDDVAAALVPIGWQDGVYRGQA